jgi:hypothetical protein
VRRPADPKIRQALADDAAAVPALVRLLPVAPAAAPPVGLGLSGGLRKGKGKGKDGIESHGAASEALLRGATAALSNCLLSERAAAAVVAEGGVPRLLALLTGPSDVLALRALNSLGRALRSADGACAPPRPCVQKCCHRRPPPNPNPN